jgi:hypothetical protein
MKSTSVKLLLVALLLFIGSVTTSYVSQLPDPAQEFTISDPPWTMWEYSSLIMLMCAVGMIVAAFKLRGR